MSKLKLQPKQLTQIGYPQTAVISVAISVMQQYYKHTSTEEALIILQAVLNNPTAYFDDPVLWKISDKLAVRPIFEAEKISLRNEPIKFETFGIDFIERAAMIQMQQAMSLPISTAGALMPDAHAGYGLPIGGVVATEGALIPYGVGVDIGCRMALSIFAIPPNELEKRERQFTQAILENTKFGTGGQWKFAENHEILESPVFGQLEILRNFEQKAARQLGTSGTGNHFVEFGVVEITQADNDLNLPCGAYIGLLSHSGSRALGATVANHYTQVAMKKRHLPKAVKSLAWLTLDEAEGMEYWLGMNLAGEYAKACHDIIHRKIARAINEKPLCMIENHHNFAWKEIINGKEAIVHRKGATPAAVGEWGIIPGSMTAKGFIVQGKGETASLNSAAHGAGRRLSRTAAKESISQNELKKQLAKHHVSLLGGGLDEAPHAYKNIDEVMHAQRGLVEVVGSFQPRIVRMAD